MTIYSIGHDIVENSRIARLVHKYNQKFISKILSIAEQEILATKTNKVKFIAKRFAAKEAFAKACGSGLRYPILMPGISVHNDHLGRPYFVLTDIIREYLNNLGITNYHLSLSDEVSLSSAFVVFEKRHEE